MVTLSRARPSSCNGRGMQSNHYSYRPTARSCVEITKMRLHIYIFTFVRNNVIASTTVTSLMSAYTQALQTMNCIWCAICSMCSFGMSWSESISPSICKSKYSSGVKMGRSNDYRDTTAFPSMYAIGYWLETKLTPRYITHGRIDRARSGTQ